LTIKNWPILYWHVFDRSNPEAISQAQNPILIQESV